MWKISRRINFFIGIFYRHFLSAFNGNLRRYLRILTCLLLFFVIFFNSIGASADNSGGANSSIESDTIYTSLVNLEMETFQIASPSEQVVSAANGDVIFTAVRNSDEIKMFSLSGKTLTLLSQLNIPDSKQHLPGERKYILDLLADKSGHFFVSFLSYYDDPAKCEHVIVVAYKIKKGKFGKSNEIFSSTPCWSMIHADHARGSVISSGRLAFDGKFLYVAGGMLQTDLSTNRYPNPFLVGLPGNFKKSLSASNLFGSVAKISISDGTSSKFATGLRSPQGLFWDPIRKILWETEHGPAGGDELNVMIKGNNYGWPFVTFGQPYHPEDKLPLNNYFKTKYGNHDGYAIPLYSWYPSIAPSQLVVIPRGTRFGGLWRNDLIVSTLKDNSLFRLHLDIDNRVVITERIEIGHRIRDISNTSNGLVLSTDDGLVIVLTAA